MKEGLFITCDVCSDKFPYPKSNPEHRHPELELGGVPINFWGEIFGLKIDEFIVDQNEIGIRKFHKLLPLDRTEIFSQNEGSTPLIKLESLSSSINVFLKDESENPTGSFKDRGMPLLVGECCVLDKKRIAIPSTGNAAASLVSYAKLAGIEPIIFLPKNVDKSKIKEIGEEATLIFDVDLIQSYEHFFDFCRKDEETHNAFPATNPIYIQGLKTAAYEIYMQMNNKSPDWIILPCGSGGNILGYYQGFKDLFNMGLISSFPKFVSVQIRGADPIAYGIENDISEELPVISNPVYSKAEAIASDTCFNYFKIKNMLKETNGFPISVSDSEINDVKEYNRLEFSSRCVFPALSLIKNEIKAGEAVLLVGTAKARSEY